MRHIVYDPTGPWPIALLIKETAFDGPELERYYTEYLEKHGIAREQVTFISLAYNEAGKAPNGFIKQELENVMTAVSDAGSDLLYCADANYFKVLTGQRKAEPHLGYVLPCVLKGYEHLQVTLGVNHKSLMYNPANEPKLHMSLETLLKYQAGAYQELGANIIKEAHYPSTLEDIKAWLEKLKEYPSLSCDIEAFSLDFDKAGIATITFCWDEHHGVAFACDYVALSKEMDSPYHGVQKDNPAVKLLLRDFFESYTGELIFHRANYDVCILIYELWMQNLLDTNGLLEGLEYMTQRFHDTKVIAYLATNSCAGNKLSLKALAHEFAGNWAQDEEAIKDIRKIPLKLLLQYNLVDGLATNYVFKKCYPIMVQDQQEELYQTLMMPSQKTIIQIELTGMPLDSNQVQVARQELESIINNQLVIFSGSTAVKKAEHIINRRAWEKDYEDRKAKAKNPDKIMPKDWDTYPRAPYNPNSGPQNQTLLYEVMDLPVIDKTATKQPATGADTIEKLINHTEDVDYKTVLQALIDYGKADKVLTSFIPAFEKAIKKGDGVVYLHGSFNLGGTVSGRLSSSGPNLQQIPSGSRFGELIKKCFKASKGWIFCGADFNALEDRINALLTKDPNKLKVFTDGFDSHCLRTYYYWPEQFPDLREIPEDINSISKTHKALRGKSKTVSFALQYAGTWTTLVNNSGFSKEEAKAIEASYHKLYAQSADWTAGEITKACKIGYATAAFGLRIRTPTLYKSILGSRSTPHEAAAESRTLGNAIGGQSYGLLNNRALVAFMKKVWASPYRFDIKPVAMIHDAIYLLIRDDVAVVEWVNQELILAMQWQELPEIQHDTVKLGAELDLYWPTWADALTIPNGSNQEQIRELVNAHLQKLNEKKEAA